MDEADFAMAIDFQFLAGRWRLSRVIDGADHFVGTAVFTRIDDQRLRCREDGVFSAGALAGGVGYRAYLYMVARQTLTIFFDDAHRRGQKYVTLDFSIESSAEGAFSCPPDLYRHRMTLRPPSAFATETRIEGPRKNSRIVTEFEKIQGGSV